MILTNSQRVEGKYWNDKWYKELIAGEWTDYIVGDYQLKGDESSYEKGGMFEGKFGHYEQPSTFVYESLYCDEDLVFCEMEFSRAVDAEPKIEQGEKMYVLIKGTQDGEGIGKYLEPTSKWMAITMP